MHTSHPKYLLSLLQLLQTKIKYAEGVDEAVRVVCGGLNKIEEKKLAIYAVKTGPKTRSMVHL
jgi:hypothetical protein